MYIMIILVITLFIIIFKNDVILLIKNTLKNSLYNKKVIWIKEFYKNIMFDYKNIMFDYKNIMFDYKNIMFDYKNIMFDYKNIMFDYKNIMSIIISIYFFIYSNKLYRFIIVIIILMRTHLNNGYHLITKFKNEHFFLNKTNF
jgi:hypothetical protein